MASWRRMQSAVSLLGMSDGVSADLAVFLGDAEGLVDADQREQELDNHGVDGESNVRQKNRWQRRHDEVVVPRSLYNGLQRKRILENGSGLSRKAESLKTLAQNV